MSKRLIVNADDFGFTRDVNEGIVEAHRNGIVTSTTIMANGSAFHHAVILAKETRSLAVGVHLVLVGERALSRLGKALPSSPARLVATLAMGGLDVERELDFQIRRVLNAGIEPSHFDTHKHTHSHPRVADAVARMVEKHGVHWVRRPLRMPVFGAMAEKRLRRPGVRMADHFLGYDLTGRFGVSELERTLRSLPEGITEFMCHPGLYGEELRQSRTRLKESRQRELDALRSPEVKQAVRESGIELTDYRQA